MVQGVVQADPKVFAHNAITSVGRGHYMPSKLGWCLMM